MKRTPLFVVFVLIVLSLGAAWWWTTSRGQDTSRPVTLEVGTLVTRNDSRTVLDSPSTTRDSATANGSSRRVPVQSDTAMEAPSGPCRFRGRVIDPRESPIEGVVVTCVGPMGSRRATSGADGRFEFSTAMPRDGWCSLRFVPPIHHARIERSFDSDGTAGSYLLVAGDNDVGDVLLADCGAFEGRVLDDHREPIAGADVSVLSTRFGTIGRTFTNSNGRFVIGSLEEGVVDLRVSAERHAEVVRRGFVVEPRATSTVDEFVLAPALTIRGVVVDQRGRPVGGLTVVGHAVGHDRHPSTTSARDGSFELWPSVDAPCWLDVMTEDEFEPFGATAENAPHVAPGTTDVRLVVNRVPTLTFRVIDSVARAPVSTYSIRAGHGRAPRSASDPESKPERHAGGITRLPVRLGGTSVRVRAPGYAPFEGWAETDPGSTDTQTIVLQPGSTIRGRAVGKGAPASGGTVELWSDPDPARSRALELEPERYELNQPRPMGSVSLGDDGRFELSDLEADSYALRLTREDCSATEVRGLTVTTGQTIDVGDVTMIPAASVSGRLLVPQEDSAGRFAVILRRTQVDGTRTVLRETRELDVRDDGTFEANRMAAGTWWIEWRRPEVEREEPTSERRNAIELALSAGDARSVTLDATGSAPCHLNILVQCGGRGVPQAEVYAILLEPGATEMPKERTRADGKPGHVWHPMPRGRSLGTTDAEGRLSTSIEGGLTFAIEVSNSQRQAIASPSVAYVSQARGTLDCTISTNSGLVELLLPAGMVFPPDAIITVSFDRAYPSASFVLGPPSSRSREEFDGMWQVGANPLGAWREGEFYVQVTFTTSQGQSSDGTIQYLSEPREFRPAHRTRVSVQSNKVTRIVVP